MRMISPQRWCCTDPVYAEPEGLNITRDVCSGYILKESGGLLKPVRRRWCVLSLAKGTICFYPDEHVRFSGHTTFFAPSC
jgi:hypothetical protein